MKNRQIVFLALNLLVALVLAVVFYSFSVRASIIADDFAYFNRFNRFGSIGGYLNYHYNLHNGRVGQALFFSIFYALFGTKTLVVTPIFLYLSLGTVFGLYIQRFLRFERFHRVNSFALAFILLPVALLSARSMYDSFLWLTSSTVYLGGLLFVLLTMYAVIVASSSSRSLWVRTPSVLLLAVWSGAFTEPLTICGVLVAALLAAVFLIRRRVRAGILWTAASVGLAVAFLIIYFSPRTILRRERNGSTNFSITEIAKSLPQESVELYRATPWWAILLLACVGFATYGALSRSWLASVKFSSIFGVALVAYVVFIPGHIAVSLMGSPNYIALRTYTVPVFFSIFVVFALMLCLGKVLNLVIKETQVIALPLYVVAVVAAVAPLVQYTHVVQGALELRADHLQERAQSVREQLDSGADKIVFEPLPVLVESEGADFNTKEFDQVSWVLKEIPEWYGVTDSDRVVIGDLPEGYCMSENTAEGVIKTWRMCQ